MNPVKFDGSNATFGEGQDGYQPLPAFQVNNLQGEVVSCWQLAEKERKQVAEHGRIWVSVWTFRHPLQPLMLYAERPDQVPPGDDCRAPAQVRAEIADLDQAMDRCHAQTARLMNQRCDLVEELERLEKEKEATCA